jgi:hypothetical protein
MLIFSLTILNILHCTDFGLPFSSLYRYVATQPWPFPSSLMVGFMASAEKNESSASKYSPMPREQVVPIDNLILSTICDIDSLPKPVVDGNELEVIYCLESSFNLHVAIIVTFTRFHFMGLQ